MTRCCSGETQVQQNGSPTAWVVVCHDCGKVLAAVDGVTWEEVYAEL